MVPTEIMHESNTLTPAALPPTPPLSASDYGDGHPTGRQGPYKAREIREFLVPQHPHSTSPGQASDSVLSTVRSHLRAPQEWLSLYSDFVLKNASSVGQIESALRSLTYIIPGRFRDAEIASESLHSSIQMLSLYHDTLLARAVSKLPGMPRIQNPHTRYTKHWAGSLNTYRRVALLLKCAQYTELLWEMAAKRRGEKVRWRVVVLIEALKAVCRFLLLRITGGRMVVPPLPEREQLLEENVGEGGPESGDEEGLFPTEEKKPKEWTMPRTGFAMPALPAPNDIGSFLMQKVLTADDIKPATTLLSRISGPAHLAEILHILRPVIYAVAMARVKNKKDWRPWLLGIAVELAARQLRTERRYNDTRETALEKEEWNRRGWAMGWWALRGAFYENVTKNWVRGLVNAKYMPGLIGGVMEDYAFLWDEYHFASDDM